MRDGHVQQAHKGLGFSHADRCPERLNPVMDWALLPGGISSPVLSRCKCSPMLEYANEMRLVGEAQVEGNIHNWLVTPCQTFLGTDYTLPKQILMRGQTREEAHESGRVT